MTATSEFLSGSERARMIARVAACLFAERGYDATGVQAIVEAAGVTKPTLYYHFGSKEGLAQALLTRPLTVLLGDLRSAVEGAEGPLEGLVGFIAEHFAFIREDPDRARFLYAVFFGPLGSSLATELAGFARQFDDLLRDAIARMTREGLVNESRSEAFFTAVRGLIVVRTMDHLYCQSELGTDLARPLVRDLLEGFGARTASAGAGP
jgi:AcrR family transcriptional regulator